MVQINGWEVLAHPLFLDQLERLVTAVEGDKAKQPESYRGRANAKLLGHLLALAFTHIPADPTRKEYHQGDTLGPEYKNWFRGKFGGGRYRLFFRYDTAKKVILLAWVNDESTKRTYGAKTDAYAVFRDMLDDGKPPANWNELYQQCADPAAQRRLDNHRTK